MEFRILGPLEVADNGRRVELGGQKLQSAARGAAPPRKRGRVGRPSDRRLVGTRPSGDRRENAEPMSRGFAGRSMAATPTLRRPACSRPEDTATCSAWSPAVWTHTCSRACSPRHDWRSRAAIPNARRRGCARPSASGEARRLRTSPTSRSRRRRSRGSRSCDSPRSRSESMPTSRSAAARRLVPELEGLVAAHPLRDRLRGLLMLALYRADRQAEALEVYQQGRRALAEELGLEPSQALQRLERQILEQDDALAGPSHAALSRLVPAPARRQPVRIALVGAAVLVAAIVGAAVRLTAAIGRSMSGRSGARPCERRDAGRCRSGPRRRTSRSAKEVSGCRRRRPIVSRIDPESRTVERTFSTLDPDRHRGRRPLGLDRQRTRVVLRLRRPGQRLATRPRVRCRHGDDPASTRTDGRRRRHRRPQPAAPGSDARRNLGDRSEWTRVADRSSDESCGGDDR